jgi:hypothetical protein
MEKGNGGEKKAAAAVAVAAEDGGAKKVEVADGGDKSKPAAEAPVCFKKTVGDDASLVDATKDYFKQLKVTDADTHWGCIKNRVRLAREYVADKTGSVRTHHLSSLPLRPAYMPSPCSFMDARVFCLVLKFPLCCVLVCGGKVAKQILRNITARVAVCGFFLRVLFVAVRSASLVLLRNVLMDFNVASLVLLVSPSVLIL